MTVRHVLSFLLLYCASDLMARDTASYYLNHPSVRAFLDVIAYAEGTYGPDGYRMLFGGDLFSSYRDHPRLIVCAFRNGRTISGSAAGRYQFLERTWDDLAQTVNARDFSPYNQDKAALEIIRMRGALSDVLNNNPERAITKLNRMWASFPGSPYGLQNSTMRDLASFYRERLAYYRRTSR